MIITCTFPFCVAEKQGHASACSSILVPSLELLQVQLLPCTEGLLQHKASLVSAASARGIIAQISLQPKHLALSICSPLVFSFLFLSQSALCRVVVLTFSTALSFHSAGDTRRPQMHGPMFQNSCPNVPQVVSLAQELPSHWKMPLPNTRLPNKLLHPSQPSASRRNFRCLPLTQCWQTVRLDPLSSHSVWLHGTSQLPFKPCRVPISSDSAQDLQLSSFLQTNRKAPSLYSQETNERRSTETHAKQSTTCVSALPAAREDFDRASTNEKLWPKDALLIPQYARPVAGETILKTFISVSNICWPDFYPMHCHAPQKRQSQDMLETSLAASTNSEQHLSADLLG